VRHENEIKLGEELEKSRQLHDLIKMKDDTLEKRNQEIEDLDKKVLELERNIEASEIKKQSIDRQAELAKK